MNSKYILRQIQLLIVLVIMYFGLIRLCWRGVKFILLMLVMLMFSIVLIILLTFLFNLVYLTTITSCEVLIGLLLIPQLKLCLVSKLMDFHLPLLHHISMLWLICYIGDKGNVQIHPTIIYNFKQSAMILVLLDTPMMPVSCPVKNVIIHANNAWLMELHAQSAMISIQPRDFL